MFRHIKVKFYTEIIMLFETKIDFKSAQRFKTIKRFLFLNSVT